MLLTPIAIHLLSAMFFGALIGAERQWRQRMAGLRTNALVATGAAVFILSSMSESVDSPGRIAAQIVSGIGFLGAGVIMRQGMNIRGLNTAATLWCSAGIGVLCGLGQYWSASIATGIILCANILLREAAQRINTQPYQQALDLEQRYKIHIVCDIHDEILVRTLILQAINGLGVRLQSLSSADATQPDRLEVCAEILATPAEQKEIESIVCRVSLEKSVSSVNWEIATELPA
ncbi:MgtC family protein [Xenorhabdus bovienii]|uniref:Protein MgtC n=1 Tax=Xenorhabdus bovienii TaxID=40576 RepID=A0AAJ1J7B1_XENBV|nr:MgtC family protein [Xenorhabdus bovienii]MDE1478427.1 MgtC family protein [Xenorhabdus bovienii]MDE1482765.1 MgtC family protein [Xenorhabdus bovienii]MDE1490214.1 MgtC family protein [Xenorhabdus bovienii]MDE1495434.1 MgtC family protein [Xenorhabdus bovienii]MDE9429630.1 MgtC family protein [Xenorhabdus bovienii]